MDKELLEILSKQNELIKEQNEMLKDQIVTMRAGFLTVSEELRVQSIYLSRLNGESFRERFSSMNDENTDMYSTLEANYMKVFNNLK